MNLRKGVNRGLITGLAMSFVGGIGMVTTFNNKLLIDPILTMGYAVLFGIPFVIALISSKRIVLEGPRESPLRESRAATNALKSNLGRPPCNLL